MFVEMPDGQEISNVGGSGGGIHVREDDDNDDDDDGKKQREDGYASGGGCTRDFAKAKQLILHALLKAEKQLLRRRNKKTSSSSGSAVAASANAGTSGKRFGCVGCRGKGRYFCFTQPQTLESPSHASDPNDPNFTYETLKAFIEKNDFYSKECNTHLDFDLTSHGAE
ncbi:uncharacterized protein LOC133864025 isoform X1 [Alnus glutinosa]|uniref:uncharacterized protein LOC133864025 isoform X1 n=1 Tax=Alnus glutinosa TaxID=3517 RepID=UPI002D770E3C|nr:uncharacterized protein LOC133864025 isoform X1 [Alnus glutinosa]